MFNERRHVASTVWRVDPATFPPGGSVAERLAFLLNYAVMAPSSHNTQPWLFRLRGSGIVLHADRSRGVPVVDTTIVNSFCRALRRCSISAWRRAASLTGPLRVGDGGHLYRPAAEAFAGVIATAVNDHGALAGWPALASTTETSTGHRPR